MINTRTDWRSRIKLYSGIGLFCVGALFAAIPVALCVLGFYMAGAVDAEGDY